MSMPIQSIIASLPGDGTGISIDQQALAHKKLAGQSLTSAEETDHATWIETDATYRKFYQNKQVRILILSEGIAKIYDATAGKIVGLACQPGMITLNGTLFQTTRFAVDTEYAVVTDMGDREIKIIERKIAKDGNPSQTNEFEVDLRDKIPSHMELNFGPDSHVHFVQVPEAYYAREKGL